MYSTSGEYDLLIKIFVPTGQDIGLFIQDNLHGIDEIVRTHTTIAFSTIPPRNAS
jgi:DNA-binding Lrp family transcriptional regulator